MKYKIEIWPIIKLIDLYNNDNLNLNPPYQRNSIWSINAQKLLIDTIKSALPLPVFFLQEKENGKYEMVDGQQRTRAILGFEKGLFNDKEDKYFEKNDFSNYDIPICVLSKTLTIEEVREFYVRVNKTGLKLERPELNKAEYYDTTFLKLVTELTNSDSFQELRLFRKSDIKRMFDRDFVEELVSLLINGITDKKKAVDRLFETDIDQIQYEEIIENFNNILGKISLLNDLHPIAETRYSQKNDFYTLFGLINDISNFSPKELEYAYKVLIKIQDGIRPSNDDCEPLQEYAINCVTQSNSKKAREKRLNILRSILLNESKVPNKIQKQVAKYYKLEEPILIELNKYYTLRII